LLHAMQATDSDVFFGGGILRMPLNS